MSPSSDTTPEPLIRPSTRERLIDRLQVALPLIQRATVTAGQTAMDTATAMTALAEMVSILRELPNPRPYPYPAERTIGDVGLAMTRHQVTLREASHLTGIAEPRMRALVAGDVPTGGEAARLASILPEWQPRLDG